LSEITHENDETLDRVWWQGAVLIRADISSYHATFAGNFICINTPNDLAAASESDYVI
jgi:hypothetical protein